MIQEIVIEFEPEKIQVARDFVQACRDAGLESSFRFVNHEVHNEAAEGKVTKTILPAARTRLNGGAQAFRIYSQIYNQFKWQFSK